MKLFTTILFLFCVFCIHSQGDENKKILKSKYQGFSSAIKGDVNFKKAYLFFLEGNSDSTLIYSHNFLASQKVKDEYSDYCHYFRGISFIDKKLFVNARKEFELIPTSFPFAYEVKMKLGAIALELEEYSKALDYFLEVKKISNTHPSGDDKRSLLYQNIGLCYLHLGKFESCEKYLSESLKLQEISGDTTMLIVSYMNVANLYYNQYLDNLAIPLFEKAYALSKISDNFQIKQNAALNMAVVEESRERYVESLNYRKEYEQWRDSLNDQNRIWEVAELEKKFISEQKQKEIEILEKENTVKRAQLNTFISSSVLLLILASTLFYFYRSKKKVNKIILAQKNALDALNDTKDRLFSIVSHDLRSNVNALDKTNSEVSELFQNKAFEEVEQHLDQCSALTNSTKTLLDNMLNWALLQTEQMFFQPENLSLRSILDQVTLNYEPLMTAKRMNMEVSVPKNIFIHADSESLKIVLRNVLDNAIKYSSIEDTVSIYVGNQDDKYCQIIIEDTGKGMDKNSLHQVIDKTKGKSASVSRERTGLGLHLCSEMMKKNKGTLNIESEENIGTRLILTLPIMKDYE